MEFCGVSATGALDDPPPKRPPMAWPIEEPTATPLLIGAGCFQLAMALCIKTKVEYGGVSGKDDMLGRG